MSISSVTAGMSHEKHRFRSRLLFKIKRSICSYQPMSDVKNMHHLAYVYRGSDITLPRHHLALSTVCVMPKNIANFTCTCNNRRLFTCSAVRSCLFCMSNVLETGYIAAAHGHMHPCVQVCQLSTIITSHLCMLNMAYTGKVPPRQVTSTPFCKHIN